MDFFNLSVHHWYSVNKRDLPWRNTSNPYNIWLSEIILQQTRIDQGISYYFRFLDEFPTIQRLAAAHEDQVLKLWQGLGYYSRARNLHFTAKELVRNYNGQFPSDYSSIRSLKGIGEYTAAAIASISFGLEHAAVDGNVYRVLSRFFGINHPIDSSAGKKVFFVLASELIRGTDPGMHNQALMEFGALQCVPRNPDCSQCPLAERCSANASGRVSELPVKQNKTKQRDQYFNYIVIVSGRNTWLRKRTENDIWKNLFEFPVLETAERMDIFQMFESVKENILNDFEDFFIENVTEWKIHILSHQRIHYRFVLVRTFGEIKLPVDLIKVNKEDIFNFAVPKLLENYLDENLENGLFVQ